MPRKTIKGLEVQIANLEKDVETKRCAMEKLSKSHKNACRQVEGHAKRNKQLVDTQNRLQGAYDDLEDRFNDAVNDIGNAADKLRRNKYWVLGGLVAGVILGAWIF